MLICSKCKNTIDERDAILRGYVCKVCGKFNLLQEATMHCFEKPARRQLSFKQTVKKITRKLEMIKKLIDFRIK